MLCKVMEVSRTGYYNWRNREPSARDKEHERLVSRVREIHKKSRGTYGSRRIVQQLQLGGNSCGKHKAGVLMKLAGVEARPKKKFKATTDSKHNLPVAPNLLKRDFSTNAPGCVLVWDITYIWTKEGWLYLAVVIDLFSRRVVGWALNRRMTKQLAIDALLMAIWRVKPIKGAMFHSDRGSQYCSHAFQRVLRLYGMRSSMSRKGDC